MRTHTQSGNIVDKSAGRVTMSIKAVVLKMTDAEAEEA